MVKVWAEKERRNLVRLQAAGIRSPQPLQLRSHVLIMDFIGTHGVAAPRLKVHVKATYSSCRLVHRTAFIVGRLLTVTVTSCNITDEFLRKFTIMTLTNYL